MYRRRRGYKIVRSKKRYSNETTTIAFARDFSNAETQPKTGQANTLGYTLVSAASLQGTRKVKNMTISLSSIGCPVPLICAVIYCPGGIAPSPITVPSASEAVGASMYEPNQNVIMTFVLNPAKSDTLVNTNVQTFRTRLARNLDSNDYIALIVCPSIPLAASTNVKVSGTFNYAIAY